MKRSSVADASDASRRSQLVGSCIEPVVGYGSDNSSRAAFEHVDSGATMIRKMDTRRWTELTEASERVRAQLIGWSPGGAASQLGISRQAVHKAIKRGDLDAVIVTRDGSDELSMFMIPDASLQAFKARREQRKVG